jgi:ABC-type glycerol-3-phosphate transport system substrate-binding protein
LAWEFIKFMHFDVKNIIVEYEVGALYPSLKAASSGGANAALFKKGNPYFGGASIGELTGVVASSLRAPYTSPIWTDLVLPTGVLPVSVLEPYMTDATASPSDAAKLLGAAQKVAMEKYRALKL